MPIDLTALTVAELDGLRTDVLVERDRRQRIEQAPERITVAITDARSVGIDHASIRAVVDTVLEGN